MTTYTKIQIAASCVGIPTFVWFCYLTSWQTGLALFVLLAANNVSQMDKP